MNVDSTIINDNFATLLVQSFFAKKNLTWIYFLVSLANCIVLFLRIVKFLNIWKVWYLALALPSVFTSCHLGMIEVALPTTLDDHHHCHPHCHHHYQHRCHVFFVTKTSYALRPEGLLRVEICHLPKIFGPLYDPFHEVMPFCIWRFPWVNWYEIV